MTNLMVVTIDWLFFAAVAVLVGSVFCFQRISQHRRIEAWRKTAEELGLQFLAEDPTVLPRFGHLRLLKQGRSQRMKNVIHGDAGDTEIFVGDFQYVTGSGKSQKTHTCTVSILHASDLRLPHCFLRPQSRLFDFLGRLFGGQDIDFAEDPGFSAAYVLQADDEPAARRLFDAGVRNYFSARKSQRLNFEIDGGAFLFHTQRRLKPEQARELIGQALEIKQLLSPGTSEK